MYLQRGFIWFDGREVKAEIRGRRSGFLAGNSSRI